MGKGMATQRRVLPLSMPTFSPAQLERSRLRPEDFDRDPSTLDSSVRALLWSTPFASVFAQASVAAEIAMRSDAAIDGAMIVYLGRGREAAVELVKTQGHYIEDDVAHSLAEMKLSLADPDDASTAWQLADLALQQLLIWPEVALVLPPAALLERALAAAKTSLRRAESSEADSEDEALDLDEDAQATLNLTRARHTAWANALSGRLDAATLLESYNVVGERTRNAADNWSVVPDLGVISALDYISSQGVKADLTNIIVIPESLRERGGWWNPSPRPSR